MIKPLRSKIHMLLCNIFCGVGVVNPAWFVRVVFTRREKCSNHGYFLSNKSHQHSSRLNQVAGNSTVLYIVLKRKI